MFDCMNCEEERDVECYECYVLSGDEARDRIEYGYFTGV